MARPVEALLPRFFAWYLAAPCQQSLIMREQTGATRQGLTKAKILTFEVPLPPLNEQRRIVAKLDELLSRLDAGVAALEAARAKLKRLRASVLKSAVEGRLTVDWREAHPEVEPAGELLSRILAERRTRQIEAKLTKWRARKEKAGWTADKIAAAEPKEREKVSAKYEEPSPPETDDLPKLPATWQWATVDSLSDDVTVGHVGSMKNDYVQTGIPFLRSQNVRPLRFDTAGLKYVSSSFHSKLQKSSLRGGEVLVVRSGNIGDSCVFPIQHAPANCADLVIVRLRLAGLASYLCVYLDSPFGRAMVGSKRTGSALTHFNVGAMRSSPLPLPPTVEAVEIVRRVDEHLSRIDAAEKAIDAGLARSKRLRQSILKRAFEGKLVPQDPTDEPASVLLERIRAEREAADAEAKSNDKIRRKKKTAKKAAAKLARVTSTAPTKQLSLIGDEPEATSSIDPEQIARAFSETHEGYSPDYVIACREVNRQFLDAARSLGVEGSDVAINKYLLNVRKTLKADLAPAERSYRLPKAYRPFEFVSEIALAALRRELAAEVGRRISLDDMLCDPEWAERLDEIARRQLADAESLPIRWGAISLRKRPKSDLATVDFDTPMRLSSAGDEAPDSPGFYRISTPATPLFVGFASSLAERITRHQDSAGKLLAPSWLVPEGERPSAITFATTKNRLNAKAIAASVSACIEAETPWLNCTQQG
ncbi:MAG: restriction endonuclease subunit S [Planctomycetota bacterium]